MALITVSAPPEWGWRQNISWRWGHSRGRSGQRFSCPWWADEEVYGLAFLQAKGVDIPRDPLGKNSSAGGDAGGAGA